MPRYIWTCIYCNSFKTFNSHSLTNQSKRVEMLTNHLQGPKSRAMWLANGILISYFDSSFYHRCGLSTDPLFCLDFVKTASKILTVGDMNEPNCKGVGLGHGHSRILYLFSHACKLAEKKSLWTDYHMCGLSQICEFHRMCYLSYWNVNAHVMLHFNLKVYKHKVGGHWSFWAECQSQKKSRASGVIVVDQLNLEYCTNWKLKLYTMLVTGYPQWLVPQAGLRILAGTCNNI